MIVMFLDNTTISATVNKQNVLKTCINYSRDAILELLALVFVVVVVVVVVVIVVVVVVIVVVAAGCCCCVCI